MAPHALITGATEECKLKQRSCLQPLGQFWPLRVLSGENLNTKKIAFYRRMEEVGKMGKLVGLGWG